MLEKYELTSNLETSKEFNKECFIKDLTKALGDADGCIKVLEIKSPEHQEKIKDQFNQLQPQIEKLADEAEHFHKSGKTALPRWKRAVNVFGNAVGAVASAVVTAVSYTAYGLLKLGAYGTITDDNAFKDPSAAVATVGKFVMISYAAESVGAFAGSAAKLITDLGSNVIKNIKGADASQWHTKISQSFCKSVLDEGKIEVTQAKAPSGPSPVPSAKVHSPKGVTK